jgi:hypothetical protein
LAGPFVRARLKANDCFAGTQLLITPFPLLAFRFFGANSGLSDNFKGVSLLICPENIFNLART